MPDLKLVPGKALGLREDRQYYERTCPRCNRKDWVQYLPKRYQPPPSPERLCQACQRATSGFNRQQYLGPRDKYRAF